MKTAILLFILAFAPTGAFSQNADDLVKLQKLSMALQQSGTTGLLLFFQTVKSPAPFIPSAWHYTNISKPEERVLDAASRRFGRQLLAELVKDANEIQHAMADEALLKKAIGLCDLGDWSAAGNGYENAMIAQRCLDLASVALARLAANTNYPFQNCRLLDVRMTPQWMSPASRCAILNKEAGCKIFDSTDQEGIEKTWMKGRRAIRQNSASNSAQLFGECMRGKMTFFHDGSELANFVGSKVIADSFDIAHFDRIVNGLELQNIYKARALVSFRSLGKGFPAKPTFLEEDLVLQKKQAEDGAKMGIKIVGFESAYSSSGEAAFAQAWQEGGMTNQPPNLWAPAWAAYSEVLSGEFFDEDRRNAGLEKPR